MGCFFVVMKMIIALRLCEYTKSHKIIFRHMNPISVRNKSEQILTELRSQEEEKEESGKDGR